MRLLRYGFLALALGLNAAQAQKIRVAVSVADTAVGGIFSSAFAAAFRALGDVEVVTKSEKPQYVLNGVVLCNPNCRNALSYSLALRLYSPFPDDLGLDLAGEIVPVEPAKTYPTRLDSALKAIHERLDSYENNHWIWVVSWGRTAYEQAVREFVGQIDAKCLETSRRMNRAVASRDSSQRASYFTWLKSRNDWLC
jgi:hypothetical protein